MDTPHKADYLGQLLRCWGWEEEEHPPYSPGISPWDFDLFSKIKEPIHGKRLATRKDFANAVHQQVSKFTQDAANTEADCIKHFPHLWQRVVTAIPALRGVAEFDRQIERGDMRQHGDDKSAQNMESENPISSGKIAITVAVGRTISQTKGISKRMREFEAPPW
ncbi:uncharacterized protein TNCV_350851 [Trichonephila clavipes]|nr:uncharacterized protein TNCV_350851 [Trichonephila clavipes]